AATPRRPRTRRPAAGSTRAVRARWRRARGSSRPFWRWSRATGWPATFTRVRRSAGSAGGRREPPGRRNAARVKPPGGIERIEVQAAGRGPAFELGEGVRSFPRFVSSDGHRGDLMTRCVARQTFALLLILTLLPSTASSRALAQDAPAAPPPGYVLSLQDAVKAALENNLDIVVRAYDPLRSEAQVITAESIFDPRLTGTASSLSSQSPTPSSFTQSSK